MQNFSNATATPLSPLPGVIAAEGIRFIRVSGADAVKFLHGQLSQAIEGLGTRTTLAGYCSARGRLNAIVRAWVEGDDIMLALPEAMAEAFMKRIRMFVLRAKVVFTPIEPMPHTRLLVGEPGATAAQAAGLTIPAEGEVIRTNGWTLLGLAPASAIDGFCVGGARALAIAPSEDAATQLGAAAPDAWRTASVIAAGVPQILPETREKFVPQHVNLELVGGVSFRKGCYPGQEVISRVEHIGETNRRAAICRVTLGTQEAPKAGDPVWSAGEEVGTVVLATHIGDEALVLCSATLSGLENGLALTADGAAMTVLPLPYRIRNIIKDPA